MLDSSAGLLCLDDSDVGVIYGGVLLSCEGEAWIERAEPHPERAGAAEEPGERRVARGEGRVADNDSAAAGESIFQTVVVTEEFAVFAEKRRALVLRL
jgi:hypothetical protein